MWAPLKGAGRIQCWCSIGNAHANLCRVWCGNWGRRVGAGGVGGVWVLSQHPFGEAGAGHVA